MITKGWHATIRGTVCCWVPSVCFMRCWVWWSTSSHRNASTQMYAAWEKTTARNLASDPELQRHYHKQNLMERVLWLVHCDVTAFSEEIGRAGWGVVALYVMERLDCMELSFGNDKVDNLLVGVKKWANKRRIVEEVDYILPSQDEDTDE